MAFPSLNSIPLTLALTLAAPQVGPDGSRPPGSGQPQSENRDTHGFVSLFDGKTLSGWEGNLEYWKAADGVIIGKSPGIKHNEFLCSTKEFDNFELHVTFRITGDESKNSGIQFRSKRVPDSSEVSGYQADIGQNHWGNLYDESRRNKVLVRAPEKDLVDRIKYDDWNTYVIRCDGPHITLTLNGVNTVDYTEPDDSIPQTGVIGLQIHSGKPLEVQFKNLRIKKIEKTK